MKTRNRRGVPRKPCGILGGVPAYRPGHAPNPSVTREALRTQSPQAVLIEGTSLFFNTCQNYTQINVGYMPFSLNKLGAIFTASEPELRSGLLFDLYFYHTRWKEVALSGVKRALTPARPDHYKGYTAAGGHGCRPLCGGPERGPAGLRRKPGVAG